MFCISFSYVWGLLKQSDLWKNYTWDDLLDLAKSVINPASYVQTEFLALVQKAKDIYMPEKKKKRVAKRNNLFFETSSNKLCGFVCDAPFNC